MCYRIHSPTRHIHGGMLRKQNWLYILSQVRALKQAAIENGNFLLRLSAGGADGFDCCHDIHALNNLSEHNVAAVEPRGLHSGEEELGAIGVRASVRHAKDTSASVLEFEILVSELRAVNALTASAVAAGEVTALNHEVRDDAVERATLEMKCLSSGRFAFVASAKVNEVRHSLWYVLAVKTYGDTLRLLVANFDIEVHLVCDLRLIGRH